MVATIRPDGRMFFDSEKVLRAADRGRRVALSRAGAFVRTRARSSIRKPRKRRKPPANLRGLELHRWHREEDARVSSAPGEPPRSATGRLRLILFAYEPARKSVVVGPMRLSRSRDSRVMRSLEEGGPVRARVKSAGRGGRVRVATRDVRIQPRPYMAPALAEELSKMQQAFRDIIDGR